MKTILNARKLLLVTVLILSIMALSLLKEIRSLRYRSRQNHGKPIGWGLGI
ncbi:MAG: hypothetical protein CM1200mP3_08650 [Chloroflexota bacterium]|nr:MAG: hypothetical protein CM1200mP3_08650 [Chloroflexota bacterium]